MTDSSSQIVLLTDFGQQDGYVGTMKGVISGIAPAVPIIDLTHDLPPQDLCAAQFVLWNSYKHFPDGSIFVCVVDPGVGSGRHILAFHDGRHIFIAPDNGLLDYVMSERPARHLLRVESPRVMRAEISHTFHGRDIFAPAAAHIASGFPFTMIGPMHPYTLPSSPFIEISGPSPTEATVIYIDRFGNLITNLRFTDQLIGGHVTVRGNTFPISTTYATVAEDDLLGLPGSHGLLEVAVRNGHAAHVLEAEYGSPVLVTH